MWYILVEFVLEIGFLGMTGVENSTVPRPDVLTRKRRRTVENGEKITDIQQKNH
jgi:hypothetical protein